VGVEKWEREEWERVEKWERGGQNELKG
jgi:hypothetical protein